MPYYKLSAEHKYDKAYGIYETYGIAVMEQGVTLQTIGDISLDKDKVHALINRFNVNHLSLEHLRQAVEEFLYDFEVY